MNRYESYQDSGIPWLGEVPKHWGIKKLNYMVINIADVDHYMPEDADNGVPYVMTGNLKEYTHQVDFDNCKKISELDFKKLTKKIKTEKGDIIFARYATIGTVCYVDTNNDFVVSYSCVTIKTNKTKLNSLYLYYYLKSIPFSEEVKQYINTNTQGNVGIDTLNKVKIVAPPLPEQTAIADYLDNKLGEIDALISKQETLLEKLAEQRTAIITHAVTKGLNAHAPMKNSGVAWLGNVPEHWGTWKITHAIDLIGSGTTPKSDNADYYDGEILWVTTSELRENFIDDTKQKITDYAIQNYSALKIYPKNSVAIAMYGATIGRLGILSKDATFNQACCVFGNSKKLHYKFLFYWLWYRRPILISLSNGGGQPNLSQDDLKKLKIPLPPLPEQTAIADYLDEQTAKIDRLSDMVNQAIASLKAYRSALITQAVTGKIKVI